MRRIYERDIDALVLRNLRNNPQFLEAFLAALGVAAKPGDSALVLCQTRHKADSGSIDFEIHLGTSLILLVENKIDAGYSTTRLGSGQVDRYLRSCASIRQRGLDARFVLLSPRVYRQSTKAFEGFDSFVDYEDLRHALSGDDRALLEEAILQASTPYEPEPNAQSADFFRAYEEFVEQRFNQLVLKCNPNANGVRPTGSHTIYFDVQRTLARYLHLPTTRMSVQCWDSTAASASVKIMIAEWGKYYHRLLVPSSLTDIGAYLRPAGKSLGIVIDTPRMDTQLSLSNQLSEVVEGLEAALKLQNWWLNNLDTLNEWSECIRHLR